MKKVEVVAGILFWKNKILCVQRGFNKLAYISEKFEFPGGKIEPKETKETALKRELLEELDITPTIKEYYSTVIHTYPDFELTMHTYKCELDSDDILLKEHISYKWLNAKELLALDWAEADLPIVNQLIEEYGLGNK